MGAVIEQAGEVRNDVLAAGHVRLFVEGPLATVVLDLPERRNAMTPSRWAALAAVPDLLPADVVVVLVRGEGATFCAGLDLRLAGPDGVPGEQSIPDVAALGEQGIQDWIEVQQRAHTWLADPRWISVAAIQGAAVGAGFQLALAADVRVVATDARFCMKEVALGLVPDVTGTATLYRAVGYSRALELSASARWIDAAEAMSMGLAVRVVEPDSLATAAAEVCAGFTANPPAAVRAVKQLMLGAAGRSQAEQVAAERAAQVPLLQALAARIS
jgi:enoyl-CoA hydratase/carnithine racemase